MWGSAPGLWCWSGCSCSPGPRGPVRGRGWLGVSDGRRGMVVTNDLRCFALFTELSAGRAGAGGDPAQPCCLGGNLCPQSSTVRGLAGATVEESSICPRRAGSPRAGVWNRPSTRLAAPGSLALLLGPTGAAGQPPDAFGRGRHCRTNGPRTDPGPGKADAFVVLRPQDQKEQTHEDPPAGRPGAAGPGRPLNHPPHQPRAPTAQPQTGRRSLAARMDPAGWGDLWLHLDA
jgi:hypothetical protein